MIKKTVNYVDYNGDQQTEDLYFNLTKAELAMMEVSHKGGLKATIERIAETKDNATLIEIFQDILTKSIGRRSEDGKRFIKNPTIVEEFVSSEAYSTIFMELAFNDQAAVDFMLGVIPKDLIKPEDVANITTNA